jgi:hypothetical protein
MKPVRRLAKTYGESGLSGVAQALGRKLKKSGIPQITWTNEIYWISAAQPGWLDRGNINCFDYAMKRLPSDAPIVEVGAFCGLSTNMLAHLKDTHGRRNVLITCDRWLWSTDEYNEFIKQTFIRNVKMFSPKDPPYAIEVYSDEFFEKWTGGAKVQDVLGRSVTLGGPISFAYIDGDHEYAPVKRDFKNVDRYLQVGGFVLFDDSSEHSAWGVNKLMLEIKEIGRYKLLDKNPHYFWEKLA